MERSELEFELKTDKGLSIYNTPKAVRHHYNVYSGCYYALRTTVSFCYLDKFVFFSQISWGGGKSRRRYILPHNIFLINIL